MSVITTDLLVEAVRRDEVLAWLAKPENHGRALDGAFDGLVTKGPGVWALTLRVPPLAREMSYTFEHVDEEHGGRRVHVKLGGRRTTGTLHYSLRTMKPAANTLVTIHVDLESGGLLGQVVEMAGLRKKIEVGLGKVLANVKRMVEAEHGTKPDAR